MKRVFLKAARDAIKEQPRDSPVRDGTIGQPVVRQVKLLRATDRFDSKGEGRSKRYGFLEFEHHEHSLLALRRLNNNPDAFAASEDISKGGRSVRPFVEFALEDVRKLLVRTQKLAAALKRKAIKEKQAAELEALEGAKAKAAKPKIKSSEQPTKKAPKPVADPQAGGGRGACFVCGLGGHVAARCPQNANSAAAAGEKVKPVAAAAPAAAAAAGGKRKAAEAAEPPAKKQKGAAPAAAATAAVAASEDSEPSGGGGRAKKNKNNRHRDVAVPKHLRDGEDDDKQFDKIASKYKNKFAKEAAPPAAAKAKLNLSGETLKAAASRWFD